MMRFVTALFCLALSLLIGACDDSKAQSLTGIYQTTFENGMIDPDQSGEHCKPPNKMLGDICATPYMATNTIGLFQNNNGDLDFAASLSFFNGHSCTIEGTAKKSTDGWIFESEETPSDKCRLLIRSENDKITLDVPEDNNCGYYCGARGSLDDAEFPLSSKIQKSVASKGDLDCVSSMEETCKPQNDKKE